SPTRACTASSPSAGCWTRARAATGSALGAHQESSSLNATCRVGARWTPTLRPAAPRLRESRTTSWTTGYRCSPVAGAREALSTTITGGGRGGDDLLRELVTTVGDVLAPGGLAQMLGNWEIRRGETWTERVRDWLDEGGLDGWVV